MRSTLPRSPPQRLDVASSVGGCSCGPSVPPARSEPGRGSVPGSAARAGEPRNAHK